MFVVTGDQSILDMLLLKAILFAAQCDGVSLTSSSLGDGSKYLMKKTGKWSLMSQSNMPLREFDMNEDEMKILSMSVAVLLVSLVGLFIAGKSKCVKLMFANSAVGGWVSEFNKLRL